MAHPANDNMPVELLVEELVRWAARHPSGTNAEAAEAFRVTVREVVAAASACALTLIGADYGR